ncbi:hypothetical protein [Streptomyces regalis]|uniref:Large membrane protein n=1 Tax=Streptomyces regalis TaxID=68262 RepID=A0A0X3V3C8_9ACTN|nr:hypothetical protein [Streptomyces regalis]KUL39184.1 hypothetical protein ADL12_15660 [Streptomyces regalis]
MNTERPDNDDAGASGQDAEEARVEKEAVGAEGLGAEGEAAGGALGAGGGEADEAVRGAEATEATEAEASEAGAAPEAAETSEAPAGKGVSEQEGAAEAVPEGEDASQEASAVSAPAPAAPAADHRHDDGHRHDGAHDGARRRSPAVIASVAAAVLLVGGGGAYLAANASGGSDGGTASGASGGDTPPPLHLDGYTEGGPSGVAPGEPNPYGVTYKAGGELADGPDSAPVYRARGEVGAGEVARLAEALGVDGKPVVQGQTWKVGAQDGAGPSLQVNKQAPGTWTFYRYAPGTDNCESTTVCSKDAPDPAADPVSEAAAKKAAAPILKAVGQDDAKLDASQLMGAQRVVNASPLVGGLPTYGWTTGVTVSPQGEVVGGSGQLKAPVKGDTYPVLDAEKTLGLMNAAPGTDHRMGIGGCASPVPLKDRLEAPCGTEASTGAPAKDTVTVEKAVFGLASHYVDTRQTLVPSWLFQVRAPGAQDSFTVTYPAVDPKFLASATPPEEPTAQPTPRPTEPKDEPTSAPVTQNVAVDGYTADGRELTVAFTGGVCAEYKVTASESEEQVTIQVTATSQPDKVCILIAKVFHKTVQLDEPLGDRKVVGSDGQAIPLEKPGTRLPDAPETSGAR